MAFWSKTLIKWLLDIDKSNILSCNDELIWFDVALLWVILVYLRALFTYLLSPPLSRTGHHTPRPTLRLPCLCHIQIWYNIMLGLGGVPLIECLRAQTTSTRTPVLASPTQSETASGDCLLTNVSQLDRAVWSQPSDHILRRLYEVLFSVLKIYSMLIFIFN